MILAHPRRDSLCGALFDACADGASYPAELAETLQWNDETILIRPIRPEDEAQHLEFLSHLDPADIRIDTNDLSPEAAADRIVAALRSQIGLP